MRFAMSAPLRVFAPHRAECPATFSGYPARLAAESADPALCDAMCRLLYHILVARLTASRNIRV